MFLLRRSLFVLVTLMVATSALPSAPAEPATVVLLHGLGLRSWAMWRIEQTLRREGYRVINLTYPSRTQPLEQLAHEWLPAQLAAHGLPDEHALHFVTHSMGGIVLRAWLKDQPPPPQLRRVVMLAPPNQGTPLVDRIGTWRSFRVATGVNGRRLGTGADSLPRQLGPWPEGPDLGVIAGDRPILPLFNWWTDAASDGKVPVEHTRLDGMRAHLVVHRSHTWIQYRRDVIDEILCFLHDGAFRAAPSDAAAH